MVKRRLGTKTLHTQEKDFLVIQLILQSQLKKDFLENSGVFLAHKNESKNSEISKVRHNIEYKQTANANKVFLLKQI